MGKGGGERERLQERRIVGGRERSKEKEEDRSGERKVKG